jgi:hypothetical protein
MYPQMIADAKNEGEQGAEITLGQRPRGRPTPEMNACARP